MNQVEMIEKLKTLGIPVFYDHADIGVKAPFLIIHVSQPSNPAADNVVYIEKWYFRIDLYTTKVNLRLERSIKAMLNQNEIVWTMTREYIDDALAYETEFEFETIGDDPDV